MFLLVCQGFLLPQNQEIELGKCESLLVTSLPERKQEPLWTENVLENICLGSGSPPTFLLCQAAQHGMEACSGQKLPPTSLPSETQLRRTAVLLLGSSS